MKSWNSCIVISIFFLTVHASMDHAREFIFGELKFSNELFNSTYLELLLEPCIDNQFSSSNIRFISSTSQSLNNQQANLIQSKFFYIYQPSHETMSHRISQCISENYLNTPPQSEYLSQAALSIFPLNHIVIKNYAFALENVGSGYTADSLLTQFNYLNAYRDPGAHVQEIFGTSPYLEDEHEGLLLFFRVVTRALKLLQANSSSVSLFRWHPFYEVRAVQPNYQYLGVSPGVIADLYCRTLFKMHSNLTDDFGNELLTFSSSLLPAAVHSPGQQRRIRLGVVAEDPMNSSPALCITSILIDLLTDNPYADFDLVLFDWPNSPLYFSVLMREIGTVEILNEKNIEESLSTILRAQVDILMFIGLPTQKLTNQLSMYRSAPIQIQFGVGHPLSSGSAAIDYSVLPSSMIHDLALIGGTAQPLSVDKCLAYLEVFGIAADSLTPMDIFGLRHWNDSVGMDDIASPIGPHMNEPCVLGRSGPASHAYTEQVVLFDSLAYFLDSSLNLHSDLDPYEIAIDSDCQSLDGKLRQWGLDVNLTASDLGCEGKERAINLYFCMQIPRKIHPLFDRALFGILNSDRKAKILMFHNSMGLVRRWMRHYKVSEEFIWSRFIWVKRMPHDEYLKLLSISSVFLNTFPFGAGITSSDAISACVPVVVLPEATSLLQMALSQVRSLGPIAAKLMIAHSIEDYVKSAIYLSENFLQMKQLVCAAKVNLFSNEMRQAVSKEWAEFLARLMN